MAYRMQSRLRHVGNRFNELNTELIQYRRGGTTLSIYASPILQDATELVPDAMVMRIELQNFAIDVIQLDGLRLPLRGDLIIRATGEEFRLVPLGDDTPPYDFTTSTRDRLIVHTERTKT